MTNEYVEGLPPFPDETVGGWEIRWRRTDFCPCPLHARGTTALGLTATGPGRKYYAAYLLKEPVTADKLVHARDALRTNLLLEPDPC